MELSPRLPCDAVTPREPTALSLEEFFLTAELGVEEASSYAIAELPGVAVLLYPNLEGYQRAFYREALYETTYEIAAPETEIANAGEAQGVKPETFAAFLNAFRGNRYEPSASECETAALLRGAGLITLVESISRWQAQTGLGYIVASGPSPELVQEGPIRVFRANSNILRHEGIHGQQFSADLFYLSGIFQSALRSLPEADYTALTEVLHYIGYSPYTDPTTWKFLVSDELMAFLYSSRPTGENEAKLGILSPRRSWADFRKLAYEACPSVLKEEEGVADETLASGICQDRLQYDPTAQSTGDSALAVALWLQGLLPELTPFGFSPFVTAEELAEVQSYLRPSE